MQETDVVRVLAAAAPETVPAIGDLAGRARASARRRRRRRLLATGAGAGVAAGMAAVGAVFAVSGLGLGATGTSVSPGTVPITSAGRGSVPPTSPAPASGTQPRGEKQFSGATVLPALQAALPAEDRDYVALALVSGNESDYGAGFTWGPKADGHSLNLSVYVWTPAPLGDVCAGSTVHCTSGTATLQGGPVTWMFNTDGAHGETFLIWDPHKQVSYTLAYYGPMSGPHSLGFAEVKHVALDDRVAAALQSSWRGPTD